MFGKPNLYITHVDMWFIYAFVCLYWKLIWCLNVSDVSAEFTVCQSLYHVATATAFCNCGWYLLCGTCLAHSVCTLCSRKLTPKYIFLNFLYNLGDVNEIWRTIAWINLLQNNVNVSHLTWIMTLHYLVKLEMLIAHMQHVGNIAR